MSSTTAPDVRYFIILLFNLFFEHPDHPLADDERLWAVVLMYIRPERLQLSPAFLLQLMAEFTQNELNLYARKLRRQLQSEDAFGAALKSLGKTVRDTHRVKSFVGAMCIGIEVEYSDLDIRGASMLWRELQRVAIPFCDLVVPPPTDEQYDNEVEQVSSLARLLSVREPAYVPNFQVGLNRKMHIIQKIADHHAEQAAKRTAAHLEQFDIELAQQSIHKQCDYALNSQQHRARGELMGLATLCDAYCAMGFSSQALSATLEGFLSSRRCLVGDMWTNPKSDEPRILIKEQNQPLVDKWNRDLVGWLVSMAAEFGTRATAKQFAALDIPLARLQEHVAANDESKAEAIVQRLACALAEDKVPPSLARMLVNDRELFIGLQENADDHFEAVLPAAEDLMLVQDGDTAAVDSTKHQNLARQNHSHVSDNWLEFCRLASYFWRCFGLDAVADAYYDTVEDVAPLVKHESGPLWVYCDAVLRRAVFGGDVLSGLLSMSQIKHSFLNSDVQSLAWNDQAQGVASIVYALALIQSHAIEPARGALTQLLGLQVPPAQEDAVTYANVLIEMNTGNFHTAYTLAVRGARKNPNTFRELYFLTKAVRALVLSRDPAYGPQAHELLTYVLRRAISGKNLGLVFELVLLQARLRLNVHDKEGCKVLCESVRHLLHVSANDPLDCEWTLLYHASSNSAAEIDERKFSQCLYTEFHADLVPANARILTVGNINPDSYNNVLSRAIAQVFSTDLSMDFSVVEHAYYELATDWALPAEEDHGINSPKDISSPRQDCHSAPIPSADSSPFNNNPPLSAPVSSEDDQLLSQKRTRATISGSPQCASSKRRSMHLNL